MTKLGFRAASLAASALLAISLSGCASAQGEEAAVVEAVSAELEALVDLDEAAAAQIGAAMGDDLAAYGVDAAEFAAAYLEGFSYEVGEVSVDGDSATAEVTMACKSAMAYAIELQEAASELAEGGLLEGASAEEVAVALGEAMLAAWDEVEPTECDPVVVGLALEGGAWSVTLESEEAVFAALMGH